MDVRIEPSWKKALASEWDKDYFRNLTGFVRERYSTRMVFPPAGKIFAAFDACPFEDVKVVILGQDPYPGFGQANGLCFSVNPEVELPRSLRNIYK
ncbi:MAG: uracil-DNA glycosylase, partial [Duncaniella sp.]|nr:uracil-DNA glycosylase [Duncaniella sp.]